MGHEKSKSFNIDGRETLIPTVHRGKQMSDREAVKAFISGKTKAIGVFRSPKEATAFAKKRSIRSGLARMNPSATGRRHR